MLPVSQAFYPELAPGWSQLITEASLEGKCGYRPYVGNEGAGGRVQHREPTRGAKAGEPRRGPMEERQGPWASRYLTAPPSCVARTRPAPVPVHQTLLGCLCGVRTRPQNSSSTRVGKGRGCCALRGHSWTINAAIYRHDMLT